MAIVSLSRVRLTGAGEPGGLRQRQRRQATETLGLRASEEWHRVGIGQRGKPANEEEKSMLRPVPTRLRHSSRLRR